MKMNHPRTRLLHLLVLGRMSAEILIQAATWPDPDPEPKSAFSNEIGGEGNTFAAFFSLLILRTLVLAGFKTLMCLGKITLFAIVEQTIC